jgi:hypothetical protein
MKLLINNSSDKYGSDLSTGLSGTLAHKIWAIINIQKLMRFYVEIRLKTVVMWNDMRKYETEVESYEYSG